MNPENDNILSTINATQELTHDTLDLRLKDPLISKNQSKSEKPSKPEKSNIIFKATYEVDDHKMSLETLASRYETSLDIMNPNNSQGLKKNQIKVKQKLYGLNVLSPPKQKTELEKFLGYFLSMFNLLLSSAGALSYVAYLIESDKVNLYLGSFLFLIVFFDCIIGYLQERSSSNIMGQFKNMLPQKCRVVREGQEDEIKAEDLVIGDIVKVQGGDKIPADLRIIVNNGLKVEQAALNGESEHVEVSDRALHENFLESKNIIFNGCLCLEGMAKGIVIKTGDNTFLGIVAQQTAQIEYKVTSLQIEVGKFVKLIGIIGISMAIVFTIGCISYKLSGGEDNTTYLHLFVNGFIIVIIANVPQGLPVTVIFCLTIIAKRLAGKKVIFGLFL